jgi:hypothetical protein
MSYDERLGHMLGITEHDYGPRTHRRTMRPVSFHIDPPQVSYPTPTELEVLLPFSYKGQLEGCCYMLAHECIHILSPVDIYTATFLEEGLATSFAHSYIRDHSAGDWSHFPEHWTHSGDERYDLARGLVECFLSKWPDAVLRLRARQPVISEITSELITQTYPGVPPSVARALTRKFHTHPPAPLQPIWLAPKKATK